MHFRGLFEKRSYSSQFPLRHLSLAQGHELGDVLFNTLLLIEVCSRSGGGSGVSVEAAAASSLAKLRRRYPPLFDGSLSGLTVEDTKRFWAQGKAAEAAAAGDGGDDDYDAALAAEIAELDRLEAEANEMADRESLARLVREEIAREMARERGEAEEKS